MTWRNLSAIESPMSDDISGINHIRSRFGSRYGLPTEKAEIKTDFVQFRECPICHKETDRRDIEAAGMCKNCFSSGVRFCITCKAVTHKKLFCRTCRAVIHYGTSGREYKFENVFSNLYYQYQHELMNFDRGFSEFFTKSILGYLKSGNVNHAKDKEFKKNGRAKKLKRS